MAGLSVGAGLAAHRSVVLLEREAHFAYHSTGRSAALFAECYGNATVRALTRASRSFYLASQSPLPFTQPRGSLYVADTTQGASLNVLQTELSTAYKRISILDPDAALRLCPMLRPGSLSGALYDPDARDIDVAAVVDYFARRFRASGGRQCRDAAVTALERTHDGWHIRAAGLEFSADVVVNSAGAWADEVARLGEVAPLGLQPCRRTAVRVNAAPWSVGAWPFVVDTDEQWYFRADAGALLLSPADETPSEPCDAQPDDYDVALAIERVEAATQLVVERPLSTWAGLRTFMPDRTPVAGFDAAARGFYWLAGQGGYGIQTAPALAELAVAQIMDRPLPETLLAEGVDAAALSPSRALSGL